MEKVYNGKKPIPVCYVTGWTGNEKKSEYFTIPEPESMRIRVQDLTRDPALIWIDLQEHKIYRSLQVVDCMRRWHDLHQNASWRIPH